MRKQTTNTFTEGLIKDFHPLTVPNNVLTDALNATLITMNGNEMVLQNDMGNGRVESAFLPPGYVPVGIKEYGGIIYVASYNPITNKGQLGSFPSPERNIDQEETGTSPATITLLNDTFTRTFKNFESKTNSHYGFLKKAELFNGKVLRSGDKFGLYFGTNSENLANFENNTVNDNGDIEHKETSAGSAGWDDVNKTYRNDLVTLSMEILDSNNNLRDITYQLKRYDDNNEVIQFTDLISEEDKFNTGYFIQSGAGDATSTVDKERDKKAINTYNNKLFGKAFFVGKVNVIDHIDVAIGVIRQEEQEAPSIDGTQDVDGGDTSSNNRQLALYITYYYNTPLGEIKDPEILPENEFINSGILPETYDKTTNLYSRQYVYTYPLADSYTEDTILNYLVTPQMKYIEQLYHLSIEGSINLSKLGSGEIKISDWRYFYTNNYMQLTWGLEAYPLDNETISNLKFEFYDQNTNESTPVYTLEIPDKLSYNGVFTELINFNEFFRKRHLYIVKISCKTYVGNSTSEKILGYRVLLTTDLYNDLYNPNFQNYLEDFGSTAEDDKKIIAEYNKIKLNAVINEKSPSQKVPEIYRTDWFQIDEDTYKLQEESWNPIVSSTQTDAQGKLILPEKYEGEQSLVKYTKIKQTRTFNISYDIADKYPFELEDTSNIEAKISLSLNDEIKSFDKIGQKVLHFPEQKTENITFNPTYEILNRYPTSETLTKEISGTDSISFSPEYFYPSQMRFEYSGKAGNIFVQRQYKNFFNKIKQDCTGQGILSWVIGYRYVPNHSDVYYLDLVKFNDLSSKSAITSDDDATSIANKGISLIIDDVYCEDHNDTVQVKTFESFKEEIIKRIKQVSSSDIVIVASPWSAGLQGDGGVSDLTTVAYDNLFIRNELGRIVGGNFNRDITDINATLKPVSNKDCGQMYRGAFPYYYYLLWKNTSGEYVFINEICDSKYNDIFNGTSNEAERVEKILSVFLADNRSETSVDFSKLYFRTNQPDEIDVFKIIIDENLTYNEDYRVAINGVLNTNITGGLNTSILQYVDSDLDYTNSPVIGEAEEIEPFISFTFDLTEDEQELEPLEIQKTEIPVLGMQDEIDLINGSYENIQGRTENGITKDADGNDLTAAMYWAKVTGNAQEGTEKIELYDASISNNINKGQMPSIFFKVVNNNLILQDDKLLVGAPTGTGQAKYCYYASPLNHAGGTHTFEFNNCEYLTLKNTSKALF